MKAFEWELERIDWPTLRVAEGFIRPPDLAAALRTLAAATTEEEATRAYWGLDNVVVLNGSVFDAAEMVVAPVLQILFDSGDFARREALELLIWITNGDEFYAETERGLAERCRARARQGLEVLYFCLDHLDFEIRDRATIVLANIELDDERLLWVLRRVAESDPSSVVRDRAASLIAERS